MLAHAAQASRKDVRDAVTAARAAFAGWSTATAYNRGQILYRVAEMLEGRRDQFADEVAAAEGLDSRRAAAQVDAAIDRLVWYAGWTDKYAQVAGATNPVAGPYFNFSLPEPTGVVGVLAPQDSSLLGLVSVVAPVIATGNTAVVVASQARPLPAISLRRGARHLRPARAASSTCSPASPPSSRPGSPSHRDVNALDLTGARGPGPAGPRAPRPPTRSSGCSCPGTTDWAARPRRSPAWRPSSRPRRSGTRSASEAPSRRVVVRHAHLPPVDRP